MVSMTTWPKRYVLGEKEDDDDRTEKRRTGPDERPANICIARRWFAENQCAGWTYSKRMYLSCKVIRKKAGSRVKNGTKNEAIEAKLQSSR